MIEKNLKLRIRFKYDIIITFISPIISIIMPIIILSKFFEFNQQFGNWTKENYYVFIFMAYNLILLENIIYEFQNQFLREKFWKTLPSLIIAPFNRFNLLLGIFFSHMIMISIPVIVFFILCYFVYPVSLFTILFVIALYLLIAFIFSGVGLVVGSFSISNENIARVLSFIMTFIFFLSCITYPYEMFPLIFQSIINLNPLYYILDFIRLAWIEDNISFTINAHLFSFSVLIITAIIIPILSVLIFNFIFKKYGIVGY